MENQMTKVIDGLSNTKPVTFNGRELKGKTPEETIQIAQLAIEESKQELLRQNKQKIEQKIAEQKELREKKKQFLDAAEKYEQQCSEPDLKKLDVDNRLRWAKEARDKAAEIVIEGEEFEPTPSIPLYTKLKNVANNFMAWLFGHGLGWTLQVGVLLVVGYFCYEKVIDYKTEIQAINARFAELDQPTQMLAPPLDQSDIQMVFYDKFVLMLDLLGALVIMLILAPDKLFQILPFTNVSKKIWSGYAGLPETQKQWLSFAWCALVLLVTIWSHTHKSTIR